MKARSLFRRIRAFSHGFLVHLGESLGPGRQEHEQDRRDVNADKRFGQHAAANGRTDRVPADRSRAGCDDQRQNTQDERERGHHDRSQTQTPRFVGRLDDFFAVPSPFDGKFRDQNCVLRRESDHQNEADLRVDVYVDSPKGDGEQGAADAERNGHQDNDRRGPTFVLRSQDEKCEGDAQGEDDCRDVPDVGFLEGHARPIVAETAWKIFRQTD